MKELSNQLTRLIRSDPITADQNPRTTNPEITPDTIMSRKALMIKVKRPRLNTLMGRVRRIRIGLKKALRIPSIAANFYRVQMKIISPLILLTHFDH